MPYALRFAQIAQESFPKLGNNNAVRLVLSLFFKAALGIPRVFHFETLRDPGFAILSGGKRVRTRQALGSLVRRASLAGVRRLMKATTPKMSRGQSHTISIDEHSIPRFTRKFNLRKGYHTIRNKHMKIEKITFAFLTSTKTLLNCVVSRGHKGLSGLANKLLPQLRRKARGAQIRLILDAGAAKNNEEFLELADYPHQITIVRTPRRPSYRKAWKKIPTDQWREIEEKGPYNDAAPKVVYVAETVTRLRVPKKKIERDVRTIVVREKGKKGKERWHALWVIGDDQSDAWALIEEFRTRQHHEQAYRIMLHDGYVDTAASGYDKESPDPSRPGFKQNSLTLCAWMVAMATEALMSFSKSLPQKFLRAHPRTLRRWFFQTPADIYLGEQTLIVALRPHRMREVWCDLIRNINTRALRIPWMENRRLVLTFDHPITAKKRRKLEMIPEGIV
jgi:hypothetical protein